MTGEFYLGEGSLQRFAQSHQDVADGITQLAGGALDATGVQNSHGPIASRVAGALSGALGSRQDTLGVTGTASNGFVDRLLGAAKSYGVHDEQGADDIRSAAEGMDGQQGSTGSGSGSSSSGTSSSGGSSSQSSGGEMIGQIGQQVGQAVSQAVSGVTQGLSQIPQQVMQGVQGVMQAVTGAGGAAGGAAGAGSTGASLAHSATETVEKASEKDDDEDRKPEHEAREEKSREHAAPGAESGATNHGPVPDAHAPAPKQPAQTRPQ